MFIKRIDVENFRSFHTKQSIKTATKNMIIGKNGSGKSNLLTAISTIFLFSDERRPQYNNNDDPATIEIEIDNTDRRFLLPNVFTLKAVFRNSVEYSINEKPISKEELRGLLENAGFTQECSVMQGKINDIALMGSDERFKLISRIAGVEKYEDSKEMALKLLGEENEEKIETMIEKIEMKMKISEEYKRKAEEYENLTKIKTEAEFELMNYELKELNDEINSIVVADKELKGLEKDESLVEYEIKSCKDEINQLKIEADEAQRFVNRFDQSIVSLITEKLKTGNFENPYDHKVSVLSSAKDEAMKKLEIAENKEKEKYIEMKALKYLDAAGSVKEDLNILEEQLKIKRDEISNFQNTPDNKNNLRLLVNERKNLWIKEKKTKDELKVLRDLEKNLENKILYLGKLSINIYETLKTRPGVIGTVFSLFDVPDHLLDAFEAVTRNSLFWIIAEDDEVATKLLNSIDGRATFVALNRVQKYQKSRINHEALKRLSDEITCDPKFRDLLEMICRDYFVCSSENTALELSEKYRINVVTTDGDIFDKNGSITGGYEGSNQTLRELKNCRRRISQLEGELNTLVGCIETLNEKIKYSEMTSEDESRILENLKAIEKYLVLKIQLIKTKKISVPNTSDVEVEHRHLSECIPKLRIEIESIEDQLARVSEKKQKIEELTEKMNFIKSSQQKIETLETREKSLIDSLYLKKMNEDLEESSKLQKKHLLIDRRTHLMKKIGVNDFRAVYIKHPKEYLISSLKDVNKKLKNFYGFSKKEILDDQRIELKQKLEELRVSKSKILEFISILDQKKEDTFNLTFSMISDNYSYFYKVFTDKSSTMLLKNKSIDILVDGKICDVNSMSGGQKSVIALSLIFAIQKNDPSPFYIFDEIDANLDIAHCERLSRIIQKSEAQYFISSFKAQMIDCCDGFYGVVSKDKESFVDVISKDLAYEIIK